MQIETSLLKNDVDHKEILKEQKENTAILNRICGKLDLATDLLKASDNSLATKIASKMLPSNKKTQ
jgi:hypothetical protein